MASLKQLDERRYKITVSNGYRPDGMPYEIYVKNHFHNLPPEEWETEIFFPVKK